MRYVLLLLVSVVLAGCQHVQKRMYTPSAGSDHLLFTSFVHKEEHNLYFLYSENGYAWKNIGSFLTVNEFGLRDPMIAQAPDGVFHCVWTTGRRDSIGYASSRDLIEWSTPRLLRVMTVEGSRNAWAPELYLDEVTGEWTICWSSSVRGMFEGTRGGGEQQGEPWNHRIFACTTTDFQTFSEPWVLFDPGFSVIDASIVKRNGEFYLLFKNEAVNPGGDGKTEYHDYIEVVKGESAHGPWGEPYRPFDIQWVEAPAPIEIRDELVVYFDHYSRHKFGAMATKDMENWKRRSVVMTIPDGHRHGTVFRVSEEIAAGVLKHAEANRPKGNTRD